MQSREPRVLVTPTLNPPPNITKVVDAAGLSLLTDFFNRVRDTQGGVLGWDVETTPVKDFYWRKLRTMQFGNTNEQYVIDLRAFCDNDPDKLYDALGNYGKKLTPGLKAVVDTISPVVTTQNFLKVGVNLSFEYECMYWQLGLRTQGFFDCAMVERCIYAGAHSLKDYPFYSMEQMMARYFGYQIDKGLQESFTLECDLTYEQLVYATLDTRYPLALRLVQLLVLKGATYKILSARNDPKAKYLEYIDPIVTGDNLEDIGKIENAAIGSFVDMHVHGDRLDTERWNARVLKAIIEFKKHLAEVMDPILVPIVGTKSQVITDADIEEAIKKWKVFNNVTPAELELKAAMRWAKKAGNIGLYNQHEQEMTALVAARKAEKEKYKEIASTLGKQRTKIKNLVAKCEGEALINYGSDAQLLKVVQQMRGLSKVESLDDDTLEKYKHISIMAAIQKYHGLKKEIGTYGYSWSTKWTTKPCKDEGWLHPGDGRLHCVFNQYDAETGRSSSEKPNGQNLPQDKEVRSSFIADAPDESIRISDCCEADTFTHTIPWDEHGVDPVMDYEQVICSKCDKPCETHAEEYVIVTADMAGAELRIIAELANDPIWISAFGRGEDVHSVGTEILYEEEWPKLQLPDCAYFKPNNEESVSANALRTLGEPQRQKCGCPEHAELRNNNKSTNFLLAYGGGPSKLAQEIKKTLQVAKDLMSLHASKFPRIWAYLDESGRSAKMSKKAFDMFGRRRLFPEPTRERARAFFISENEDKLEYDDDVAAANIANFKATNEREPTEDELWNLKHRPPTDKEISRSMIVMADRIGRQGKNHAIQGTNATIAKVAMGSGYCPEGKPYLWHTLPQYKARLIKFVHDELVICCPKRHGQAVAALVGDAFRRAAAERMKKVIMEFDFKIDKIWAK